jgi:putative hemolysin
MLVKFLKWFFGLTRINSTYARAASLGDYRTIFKSLAEVLDIGIELSEEDLGNIPAEGPVIVVANHPTGGMDGILLNALLQSVRDDLKALTHVWFEDYPELTRNMICVEPVGENGSNKKNVGSLREAVRWVRGGKMLTIYPAGSVSYFQPRKFAVSDPTWQTTIAPLIRLSRATVLPVHISGRNSLLFQLAAMIHPKLRMLLLAWELLNKRGKKLRLRIGKPIPFDNLPRDAGDEDLTSFLRHATYNLG